MYSLLIVDDETWVRQGLRYSIKWQAEDIEVIGDAEDGEQAVQLIAQRTPDIIITDIRMPGLDGLGLIELIKLHKLHTKVIIISGYSDFSYALKALKYGASDYILKPIEETSLLATVRKCVDQLNHEHQSDNAVRQLSDRVKASLPLARQHYLERLLAGDRTAFSNIDALWEALDIDLVAARLIVISLQIFDWGPIAPEPKDQSAVRYMLAEMAEEAVAATGRSLAFATDHAEDTDVIVLRSPEPADPPAQDIRLARCLESLIDGAERSLHVRVNIGVSRERVAAALPESFQEATRAGAYAFYAGYGQVYEAARLPVPPGSAYPQPYKGPDGWGARLTQAIKLGQEGMIRELVEELIRFVRDGSDTYPPDIVRSGVTRLLRDTAQRLEASARTSAHTSGPPELRLALPFCALPQLQDGLMDSLTHLLHAYGNPGHRKRVIALAVQYAESHFDAGITMNSVAEHLYLNPSYFSKLFHEEMNMTFSKFLLNLRMQKAKTLLKESTLKIYEVAQKVGYSDFRHFAKMFKEHEGMTPVQYRDAGLH